MTEKYTQPCTHFKNAIAVFGFLVLMYTSIIGIVYSAQTKTNDELQQLKQDFFVNKSTIELKIDSLKISQDDTKQLIIKKFDQLDQKLK